MFLKVYLVNSLIKVLMNKTENDSHVQSECCQPCDQDSRGSYRERFYKQHRGDFQP